jgi:hypothetical protein
MRAADAEKSVKSLQKQLLLRLEDHAAYEALEPDDFNALRRRVFRQTFKAYHLGIVGLPPFESFDTLTAFVGWLSDVPGVDAITGYDRLVLSEMCLRAALDAFRLGALVAAERAEPRP